MKKLTIHSHAKINWFLFVGPLRQDGYHELETLFQELEIHDTITIAPREDETIVLNGFPDNIPPETNLVTKAWKMALEQGHGYGLKGLEVSIEKVLPQGGGLGGGSSNAAAVLNGISRLFPQYPLDILENIAAQIGSDVAFFLNGGLAFATGRGEILTPITYSLPPVPLVLIFPEEKMSTGYAYNQLDAIPHRPSRSFSSEEFLTALEKSGPNLKLMLKNDFELVAEQYEWFNQARNLLITHGCTHSLLCGSGSTVAGIARSNSEAQEIARRIGGNAVSTTTKGSINTRR